MMNSQDSISFNRGLLSQYGFDETVEHLTSGIEKAQFLVIHTINTQQILASRGIAISKLKQILYFSPSFMERLLKPNPIAVIEAPLKFVVAEDSNGQLTTVRYISPHYLFARYDGLDTFGADLETITEGIASTIIA
jgi:uncharacterized protein (DUF302 family)